MQNCQYCQYFYHIGSFPIGKQINNDGGPDISIQFRLRKHRITKDWLLYDIVAEGISLVASKQTEFAGTIRRDGIKTLIERLENSVAYGD